MARSTEAHRRAWADGSDSKPRSWPQPSGGKPSDSFLEVAQTSAGPQLTGARFQGPGREAWRTREMRVLATREMCGPEFPGPLSSCPSGAPADEDGAGDSEQRDRPARRQVRTGKAREPGEECEGIPPFPTSQPDPGRGLAGAPPIGHDHRKTKGRLLLRVAPPFPAIPIATSVRPRSGRAAPSCLSSRRWSWGSRRRRHSSRAPTSW